MKKKLNTMTKLLRFLIILALIPNTFYSQTDTVGYYGDNGVAGFNTATVLHNNLSTCQSSVWVDGNASVWTGSVWSSGTFSLIVNGINIGSYTGPTTIDLTAYIPVTSVQVNSSAWDWHTVSAFVSVVSPSTSTPNGSPAITDLYYCVGDVTSPLTATLTSTGTTLKWFTSSFGSGYSAIAPTPSSAAAGATSYWVSQEDAGGCESVRSEIVVNVQSVSGQSVTAGQSSFLCAGSTTIDVASTETGVNYTLRDNSNNTIISGPSAGTGGAIQFNTGAITSTITYNVLAESVRNSNALNFGGNGSGDFIDMGTGINSVLTGTNTITVEAWINRTTTGSLQTIASNYGSSMQFLLRVDSDKIGFWVSNGSFTNVPGATTLPTNTWVHVAGTWDGTTMKVYVNGVLDGSKLYSGTMPSVTNTFRIGGGFGSEYFPGAISNVSVWNTTRTDMEIFNDQNRCFSGSETGLLALYKMDDGAGNLTLTDLTGNGYDGTLTNMDVNTSWINGPVSLMCATACSVQMAATPTVTINSIVDQTVNTASYTSMCSADTAIEIASSETGVSYYLRDNSNDSIIVGPIEGTGGALQFLTGGLTSTTGYNVYASKNSGSLNFNGIDKYAINSFPTGLPSGSIVTVEAWVKPNSYPDGTFNGVVSWGTRNCSPAGSSFLLSMTSQGRPSFASWCNDFVPTSGPSANLNQWNHIAAVVNGTSVKLYLNGYEWAGTLPLAVNVVNGAFCVGSTDISGRIFDGEIDEVRIWNTERTVNELNNNRYTCLTGAELGLTNYYQMEEGIGSVLTDVVGGNNLTVVGPNWMGGSPVCSDCGLQLSQTVTVTVQDILAPVADAAILSDATAECSVTSLTAPTATDNCATSVIVTNDATLPISTQGTTIVTWTYDDGNGNTFTQTQNVVITDVTAPVVPTIADATGECTVTAVAPTTTDNCSGTITGTTTDALTYTTQGTSTITWFFDDGNGNISTQTQNVVIADITNPTITAPAAISVMANAANCEASGVTLGTETSADNCGTPVVTNDAPATFPLGNTTVTWTATDAGGNTATAMQIVTVTSDLAIVSSPVVTNATCNGNSDGAIDIAVTGGTMAYTYSWDNSMTTEDLTGLGAGSFTVTVTDVNGCTDASTVAVTEPTAITIVVDNVTNPSACGATDGSVMVTTTGGTPTYSFLWDDAGSTATEDISSIGTGAYNLTVTDANGCVQASSSSLSDPNGPVVVIDSIWNLNCFGDIDGAIFSTISGGTGTLIIDWDNDGTGDNDDIDDISTLAVGTYNVVVTDAVNCVTFANATITQPAVITVTTTTIDVLCNGDATGTSALTATGGTGTLISNWGTVDTNALASGYAVYTVTDANLCSLMDSILIVEPTAISISVISTDEMSGSDGAVDLTVSGGTPTYTYVWNNSATTEDLTSLVAGTYFVTVTDANGCQDTLSATLFSQVGISENEIFAVIYPNPTSGIVTIEFAQMLDGTITVLDGIGKVVLTERITNIKQIIDLSNNERGIYFLQISKGESNTMIKIVLQ